MGGVAWDKPKEVTFPVQSNVMSPKTDSQTPSLGGLCLGK